MAAQLDYSYTTPKGVAGGKYDIAFDEVITRKNEEADGVLKYGMAAMIGTNAGSDVKFLLQAVLLIKSRASFFGQQTQNRI